MGLRSHPCTPLSPRLPPLRLSCALPDVPSLPKVACNSRTGVTQRHEVIRTGNISRGNCMRNCRAPHCAPPEKSHVIPPGPHSPTAQKPRNTNDPISKPETSSRELRAKLLGSGPCRPGGRRMACRVWPDNEATHRTTRQHTGPHWCGGRRRVRRARSGFEARRRTQ